MSAAARIAQSSSSPGRAVKMSNQASVTSSVAAAVAVNGASADRFHSAIPVVAINAVRRTSKPTHATSQCGETWREGSRIASHVVQGMRTTAETASISPALLGQTGPFSVLPLPFAGLRTAVVTPHKVLAVATALVGAISIVSALTPDLASRSEVIRGALPEGAMQFAGAITIAFGVALLWLSLALARRKRRAWQLALVLMAGTAVSHLVKGLDVEEATASLVVLAGLLAYRRSFTVRGCPHSVRPLLFEVVAAGALVGALSADAAGLISLPEKIGDAFAILLGILLFGALYLWFRPIAAQLQEGAIARAAAERIVGETGCDTLCFFALRGDKRYFFSPSGRTFLAYRVVNGVALVSGDPIGDEAESRRARRGVPPDRAGPRLEDGDPRLAGRASSRVPVHGAQARLPR